MKRCPRCRLVNPESAERCDCGYDFASETLKSSYLDAANVETLTSSGALDTASAEALKCELERGVRYVVFQYCISIIVMTFKRASRVYRLGPDESRVAIGLRYSLISLVFGWWGIPWGPVWTITTIFRNSRGGIDITHDLLAAVARGAT